MDTEALIWRVLELTDKLPRAGDPHQHSIDEMRAVASQLRAQMGTRGEAGRLELTVPPHIPKKTWTRCSLAHTVGGQAVAPESPVRVTMSASVTDQHGEVRDVTGLLGLQMETYEMSVSTMEFKMRFSEITKNFGGKHIRLQITCHGQYRNGNACPAPAVAYTAVKSRAEKRPEGIRGLFPKGRCGPLYLERFHKLGISTVAEFAAIPPSGARFAEVLESIRNPKGLMTEQVLRAAIHTANRQVAQQEDGQPRHDENAANVQVQLPEVPEASPVCQLHAPCGTQPPTVAVLQHEKPSAQAGLPQQEQQTERDVGFFDSAGWNNELLEEDRFALEALSDSGVALFSE